jgi:hypothetical protein
MDASMSYRPAPRSRRAALSRLAALGAGAAASSVTGLWPAPAKADSPCPPDPHYRLRRIDPEWLWRRACGSDQWLHSVVDERTIVAGWGDGWGIAGPSGEAKSAIDFTRFAGSATAPVISDA